MEDLDEATTSGVSKSSAIEVFHRLGMFDWLELEQFLERYISTPCFGIPICASPEIPDPGISFESVSQSVFVSRAIKVIFFTLDEPELRIEEF